MMRRTTTIQRLRLPVILAALGLLALALLTVVLAGPAQAQEPPATVDPGAGTAYLDPTLWGILQKHSTGGKVSTNVTVGMDTFNHLDMDQTLSEHITAVGGRHIEDQTWEIPTSRTLEIIQRSDVFYVVLVQDPEPTTNPRLDDTLNAITTAIANGIPPR